MPEEKVTDKNSTIVSEVSSSAAKTLEGSIQRNREFNNRLELNKSGRTIHEVSVPVVIKDTDKKLDKIDLVLKNKGMDSQQRIQAIAMIREILQEM